jgi:transposase
MGDAAQRLSKFNSVCHHFRRWSWEGVWENINTSLREQARTQAGREAQPSAVLVGSQSIKRNAVGGDRGLNAGKQVKGRKRHILVNTLGNLLKVMVTGMCLSPYFPHSCQSKNVIFAYLEAFCNRQRLHSTLGYLSPENFERAHLTG